MSQANVELVHRWMASFDSDADAFRGTLHPEIEWFPFEDNHTLSPGIEGALRVREHWLDSWDEMQITFEEIVDQSDDVIASIHVTARGRGSGIEVDTHLHLHFKVRDEKIVYVFEHTDRRKALEAAGLGE
jgi:ketosteroid isomerase-like protein